MRAISCSLAWRPTAPICSTARGARSGACTRCPSGARLSCCVSARNPGACCAPSDFAYRFAIGDTMKSFTFRTLLGAAVVAAATTALPATAQEQGKLLVWINGDKGYNGLQKIGDQFSKKSSIGVTVEHPEQAPSQFL